MTVQLSPATISDILGSVEPLARALLSDLHPDCDSHQIEVIFSRKVGRIEFTVRCPECGQWAVGRKETI